MCVLIIIQTTLEKEKLKKDSEINQTHKIYGGPCDYLQGKFNIMFDKHEYIVHLVSKLYSRISN